MSGPSRIGPAQRKPPAPASLSPRFRRRGRRHRYSAPILASLALAWALPARAAEPVAPLLGLDGIAEAALLASPLSADSVPCGVELDRLGAAARKRMEDAGLAVRDGAAARVTLSAVSVRVPGTEQCVSTVLLGVYVLESFFSASAGWVKSGYVVVWQRTLMVATPVAQHPAAVDGAVGRLAAQMLAAWREQNHAGEARASEVGAGEAGAGAGGAGRTVAQGSAGSGK